MATQAKPTKDERVPLRMTTENRDAIRRAACLRGLTMTDFLVSTALEKAEEILQEETRVRLSHRDFEALLNAIDSNDEPCETLKKAAEEFKEQTKGK
jgi:uncharacterized protein (DUF1778 family)